MNNLTKITKKKMRQKMEKKITFSQLAKVAKNR